MSRPRPRTQSDCRADELLAIRCQLGERMAFHDLIARWHEPLWRYLSQLSDEQLALDLAQEAWLRVLRGIAKLREPAKLRPWLFGIARRTAMDCLRDRYQEATDGNAVIEDIPMPEGDGKVDEDIATLDQVLVDLPIVEREVLTLFYLQELSLEEIAEVLGIPVGTVKSRLFRARQMLRGVFEKKEQSREYAK